MKLSSDDPLALAALELARNTLASQERTYPFLFKNGADSYEFDLHGAGQVSIKYTGSLRKSLTLSPKVYFATVPIVSVNGKRARVLVGGKGTDMGARDKKSENLELLKAANPRTYGK